MGITPDFSMDDVRGRLNNFLDVVVDAQIRRLQELGERCVTHARNLPPEVGFHDQTGNLRSSIGYAVFCDGKVVNSFYEPVTGSNVEGKTLNGDLGAKTGEDLANEIGGATEGVVLVVTAGMNYAAALEANGAMKIKSRRSYDVLSSAELLAEKELPTILEDLTRNILLAAE